MIPEAKNDAVARALREAFGVSGYEDIRIEALARLPGTLQRLHALPPFPRPVNYYFDTVDGFIRKFQTARILPESETAELFELYARVADVYPREAHGMGRRDLKIKRYVDEP